MHHSRCMLAAISLPARAPPSANWRPCRPSSGGQRGGPGCGRGVPTNEAIVRKFSRDVAACLRGAPARCHATVSAFYRARSLKPDRPRTREFNSENKTAARPGRPLALHIHTHDCTCAPRTPCCPHAYRSYARARLVYMCASCMHVYMTRACTGPTAALHAQRWRRRQAWPELAA